MGARLRVLLVRWNDGRATECGDSIICNVHARPKKHDTTLYLKMVDIELEDDIPSDLPLNKAVTSRREMSSPGTRLTNFDSPF